jgi:hypothetical protein
MNADYNLFRQSDWRVYLISGAIRMNQPSVVKWMFRNGWFDYVTAEKCAKIGLVEVILWMWIHRFPFCAGYDPTIKKYFCRQGDIWYINTREIEDHYDDRNPNKANFRTKVYGRNRESYKHVLRDEFWDDDEYDYNFEVVAGTWYHQGFKLVYQRDTTNPPTTMEIDLASDKENGALDSQHSGSSYPRIGYDFPNYVLRIIFDCIGPGHYLYVALVCKKFCALYKERSLRTAYRNAGASITCATFAMNADYNLFDKSEWRVYLISGAIRMNRPLVVEWMFSNGWFDYVTADKCAEMGLVEVILWMWIRTFPFLDENEDEYDPNLINYFWVKGDIWSFDTQAIIRTKDYTYLPTTRFEVKVNSRLRESHEHVLREDFWDHGVSYYNLVCLNDKYTVWY